MSIRDAITVNGAALADLTLAGDFYEWQPVEIGFAPQSGMVSARLHVGDDDLSLPSTTLGDPIWRWRWNPQHAVGRFRAALELTFADRASAVEAFELRIVPRKLDIEQYEALIRAVQQDVFAIVYALSGGREGAALQAPSTAQRPLVEEYYTLVERHVVEALALVKQIGSRPGQMLQQQPTIAQLPEVDRLDGAALAEAVRGPLDDLPDNVLPELQAALRPPDRSRGGPVPRLVRSSRSTASHDLIEHRLLKHVLQVLTWRLGFVREMLLREVQRRQRNAEVIDDGGAMDLFQVWQKRCATALRSIRLALAQPWLEGVGPLHALAGPTHLMRREPRYRRLYDLYRQLRAAPFVALDSPTLWLPVQELPLLYEQWCALQVVRAMLPLGKIVEQSLVIRDQPAADSVRSERWTLRLRQNTPLLIVECADQTRLAVFYQRRYGPQPPEISRLGALDPFVRIPDIAVELSQADMPPHVLIFDAKYRVLPGGSVPQDALDDAYTYRGAIGVAGARSTLGAFLLFPGSVPLTTADHVGALPLLPAASGDLTALLRRFLGSDRDR